MRRLVTSSLTEFGESNNGDLASSLLILSSYLSVGAVRLLAKIMGDITTLLVEGVLIAVVLFAVGTLGTGCKPFCRTLSTVSSNKFCKWKGG